MNTVRTSRQMHLAWLGAASLLSLTCVAQAQTAPPKKGLIKRHPTASTAVAGVAAHHYAKTRKSGIMHRHPVATGVAAAAVTHHYAKKK